MWSPDAAAPEEWCGSIYFAAIESAVDLQRGERPCSFIGVSCVSCWVCDNDVMKARFVSRRALLPLVSVLLSTLLTKSKDRYFIFYYEGRMPEWPQFNGLLLQTGLLRLCSPPPHHCQYICIGLTQSYRSRVDCIATVTAWLCLKSINVQLIVLDSWMWFIIMERGHYIF